MTINVGIIGYGHWGPNHLRIFSELPGSRVAAAADLSGENLRRMKERFPEVEAVRDYREVVRRPDIRAVCVTTPTSTHYEIVKYALENGKDVLCEKPLTVKEEEAAELAELAARRGRILMVGHVFLFNPGIRKLKSYIETGELGKIQYGYSVRTNLGPFRYDVNAVWDLASHDVSIFNFLLGRLPREVSARGHRCLSPQREDLAFINLLYPDDILVNIHVSWLDPKKIRKIIMVGDNKMAGFDDLEAAPLQLYDKHVERGLLFYQTFGEFQFLSREGEATIPELEKTEPLRAQDTFFIESVQSRIPPEIVDGKRGWEVVKILSAAQSSIDRGGTPVKIV